MVSIRTAISTAIVAAVAVAGARHATAQAPIPFAPIPASLGGAGDPQPPEQPPVTVVEVGDENERALVDRALAAWHADAAKMPAFTVEFSRFHAGALFGGSDRVTGRIRYVAPALGSYESDDQFNWVYDGGTVYHFIPFMHRIHEYRLADDSFATPVTAAPFPLLYVPSPELMRKRFYLRPITPPEATGQLWLEARPKTATDYCAYARAEFILKLPEHRLYALKFFHLNGRESTTYVFGRHQATPFQDVLWEIGQCLQVSGDWESEVIKTDLSLQPRTR